MATDRQAEIAASVAACRILAPAMTRHWPKVSWNASARRSISESRPRSTNRVTAEVDNRILTQLDRYAGCRHQRRRAKRMIRAERRMIRAERADPSSRQSIMLALGSMLVALAVTAIVLKGSPGVAAIMLMTLIWVIVGIINVAYAIRKHPQH